MKNIVALISYNGTNYQGFQAYEPKNSISFYISQAFSRVANQNVKITCAGRTDKGVHATYQVINFHTTASRSTENWLVGANTYLPDDIMVREVVISDDVEFSARFSASRRYYRYIIFRGLSEHYSNVALNVSADLDVNAMDKAAKHLLGEQDFSCFRNKDCCSHTPFRFVEVASVFSEGKFVVFDISANAFLHNMVRNIVGSLLYVGLGKKDEDWLRDIIVSRDRKNIAPIASPRGLYLVGVRYKNELFRSPNFYLRNILVDREIRW